MLAVFHQLFQAISLYGTRAIPYVCLSSRSTGIFLLKKPKCIFNHNSDKCICKHFCFIAYMSKAMGTHTFWIPTVFSDIDRSYCICFLNVLTFCSYFSALSFSLCIYISPHPTSTPFPSLSPFPSTVPLFVSFYLSSCTGLEPYSPWSQE